MPTLVRSWQPGDQRGVYAVLREGSFSNLSPSFYIALRRPAILCTAVVVVATCLGTGAGYVTTALALLALVALVYLTCLVGTLYFFYGPNFDDVKQVESTYFDSPDHHFWVAEAEGEIVGTIAVVRKPALNIADDGTYNKTERNASSDNPANDGTKKTEQNTSSDNPADAGTKKTEQSSYTADDGTAKKTEQNTSSDNPAGDETKKTKQSTAVDSGTCPRKISRDAPHVPAVKVAKLRRMAVKQNFRGCGIARKLVRAVIDYCVNHNYDEIFLITTEVHQPARALYRSMGFKQKAFKPYKYLYGLFTVWTYEFSLELASENLQKAPDS